MKLNWGHKITITYMLFVILIGFLVYKSMQEKFELTSADYYDKAVHYNEQYTGMKNMQQFDRKLSLAYSPADSVFVVVYPEIPEQQFFTGELLFFKPDDATCDFKIPVRHDAAFVQEVKNIKGRKGLWILKASLQYKGTNCYDEQRILIK